MRLQFNRTLVQLFLQHIGSPGFQQERTTFLPLPRDINVLLRGAPFFAGRSRWGIKFIHRQVIEVIRLKGVKFADDAQNEYIYVFAIDNEVWRILFYP